MILLWRLRNWYRCHKNHTSYELVGANDEDGIFMWSDWYICSICERPISSRQVTKRIKKHDAIRRENR